MSLVQSHSTSAPISTTPSLSRFHISQEILDENIRISKMITLIPDINGQLNAVVDLDFRISGQISCTTTAMARRDIPELSVFSNHMDYIRNGADKSLILDTLCAEIACSLHPLTQSISLAVDQIGYKYAHKVDLDIQLTLLRLAYIKLVEYGFQQEYAQNIISRYLEQLDKTLTSSIDNIGEIFNRKSSNLPHVRTQTNAY